MTRPPPRSTLFLHDALPIYGGAPAAPAPPKDPKLAPKLEAGSSGAIGDAALSPPLWLLGQPEEVEVDRKSTRLNSSHSQISYAVFCLKKKTTTVTRP